MAFQRRTHVKDLFAEIWKPVEDSDGAIEQSAQGLQLEIAPRRAGRPWLSDTRE
jgi:hypothetical protein